MMLKIIVFLSSIFLANFSSGKSCSIPENFENGIIKTIYHKGKQYYRVQCAHGYYTTDASYYTYIPCVSDNWRKPIPQCLKYSGPICGALKSPLNGKKTCVVNVPKINSTCNFYCKRGFELTGSRTRKCQENLEWSGEEAFCVPPAGFYEQRRCKPLHWPENGKSNCSMDDRGVGLLCSFECHDSYDLMGSPNRQCGENLQWSGNEVFCFPKKSIQDNAADKCLQGPPKCDQFCSNTMESYRCSCLPGYMLVDSHKCEDIDECSSEKTNPCQHQCHNTYGGFKCSCSPGYILVDGTKCEDIDECSSEKTNPCQHKCHNTYGSFYCSCSPGYILVDGTKCEGCRRNSYRSIEDGLCEKCPLNSFTETDGKTSIADCQCLQGFVGDPSRHISCTDVDECETNNFGCSHKCVNLPGSVFCSCPRGLGLGLNNKTCIDIDECSINNGGCQRFCMNEIGSFRCFCGDGYTLSKLNRYLCDDIDECAINNGGCSDICVNFPGSYYCSCKSGYRLDEFQKNCIAITCPNVPTPHYSNKHCRIDNVRIQHDMEAYPVNTSCNFKCIRGFKEQFRGEIECQEDGNWSGEIPKCIGQTCPPLSAPENGTVLPLSCLKDTRTVKEKCTYACNLGYVLKASKPVVRCRQNLTWSSSEIPKCVPAKIKPFISCPSDITVDLPPQKNFTIITIPEPDTNSEFEISPSWVSVGRPTTFPAGRSDITLKIKNSKIKCTTTVNVLDKEPPVFDSCPNSTEIEGASAFGMPVLWEDPVVVDNVGVESLYRSLELNSTLTPGVHKVEYMAQDAAGNTATCSFEITISSVQCAEIEGPLHGQVDCMDWVLGQICTPSCDDGYMRDPKDSEYYVCNDSGVWNPSNIVSECLEYYSPINLPCESGFKLLENTTETICMQCPKEMDSTEESQTC